MGTSMRSLATQTPSLITLQRMCRPLGTAQFSRRVLFPRSSTISPRRALNDAASAPEFFIFHLTEYGDGTLHSHDELPLPLSGTGYPLEKNHETHLD